MGMQRLLVLGYGCLWAASGAVVLASEELSGSFGLLLVVTAVGLAAGLWRGSPVAWWVALTMEVLAAGLLLSLLAWPWGGAATALVVLGMLRMVVLLQRPLRQDTNQQAPADHAEHDPRV
jgi:hypothetical protein